MGVQGIRACMGELVGETPNELPRQAPVQDLGLKDSGEQLQACKAFIAFDSDFGTFRVVPHMHIVQSNLVLSNRHLQTPSPMKAC